MPFTERPREGAFLLWGRKPLAMLGPMRHLAWLGLLLATAATGGTAYKSIGPDGSVVYTDRPTPNAQEVRLPEPSVYTAPAAPATGSAPALAGEPLAADLYTAIRITAPPDDATLFVAQGGVDVDVLLEPALLDGHTLSYVVDGKEVAKGLRTNRIRITDLDRGTHHLEVAVRDDGGSLVGRSARITFHLRQSSLFDPLRDKDGKDENDKPDKDPTYKPPADKPPYVPPAPTTPPYAPPTSSKPAYQPPASATSPYAPPAKAPSYVPPPPARPPYAPSFTPK